MQSSAARYLFSKDNLKTKMALLSCSGAFVAVISLIGSEKPPTPDNTDDHKNTQKMVEPTTVNMSPAERKKQIRDEINHTAQEFYKGVLGADYKLPNPVAKAPQSEPPSPLNRSTELVRNVSKSSKKWNMDALFKYPDAIKNGLDKLMNMNVDNAFNKAVAVESGGQQFDVNGNPLRSSQNAIGVAQVLPSTASVIAQRCTGDKLDVNRFYYDANYNYELGRCYYREQYETFGNNTVMAALAYNTGPGNLDRHINRVGDPTKGEIDMVDFIKSLPYTETREYTLHMMKKGGLLDSTSLGSDITNSGSYLGQSFSSASNSAYYGTQRHGRKGRQNYFSGAATPEPSHKGTQYLYGSAPETRYLSAR